MAKLGLKLGILYSRLEIMISWYRVISFLLIQLGTISPHTATSLTAFKENELRNKEELLGFLPPGAPQATGRTQGPQNSKQLLKAGGFVLRRLKLHIWWEQHLYQMDKCIYFDGSINWPLPQLFLSSQASHNSTTFRPTNNPLNIQVKGSHMSPILNQNLEMIRFSKKGMWKAKTAKELGLMC